MLLKLLKKYNVEDYYFVYYEHKQKGFITTLALAEDPLNYIDLLNKEEMSAFGHQYKISLAKCPNPYNSLKITPRKAVKWAKKLLENYTENVLANLNSGNAHPYGINK